MQDSPHKPSHESRTAGKLVPAAVRNVPVALDPYRQVGGYGPGAGDPPGDGRRLLLEYLRIVNKRKWLIVSLVGAFLVFGTLKTLMESPLYTATVRLQIDRNVAKVVEGGNIAPVEGGWDIEFM